MPASGPVTVKAGEREDERKRVDSRAHAARRRPPTPPYSIRTDDLLAEVDLVRDDLRTGRRGGAGGRAISTFFTRNTRRIEHVFLLPTLPLSSRPALNAAMKVAAPQEVGV